MHSSSNTKFCLLKTYHYPPQQMKVKIHKASASTHPESPFHLLDGNFFKELQDKHMHCTNMRFQARM